MHIPLVSVPFVKPHHFDEHTLLNPEFGSRETKVSRTEFVNVIYWVTFIMG